MKSGLKKLGIGIPKALLPRKGIDLEKWAVVACDQYTAQRGYWDDVDAFVGEEPSTLRLILPEAYLGEADEPQRIESIKRTMLTYLENGTLEEAGDGFIYVRRYAEGRLRRGLMVTLDLEAYDFSEGSQSLIRATEKTIVERIPPRIRVREGAALELPHIIVLINDPDGTVIEPLDGGVSAMRKLYDTPLMKDGGRVEGYLVDEDAANRALEALEKLADTRAFAKKYGRDKGLLLFAMGDGNHSLATAKTYWEKIKSTLDESELQTHPARYALVEIENVYDEGIVFEPIHRVLFGVEPSRALARIGELLETQGSCVSISFNANAPQCGEKGVHILPFITLGHRGCFEVENPGQQLEVGTLQHALDAFMNETKCRMDFIHDENVVTELGMEKDNIGFYLPVMDKHDLFPTVILDGALPRKTFSMGHPNEKRFYLECRKI